MIVASTGIVGCQTDVDTTLPEITQVIVDGSESESHSIQAGDTIRVSIALHDDVALKQLKVNIHAADDGHSHGSGSGLVDQPNVGAWMYSKIFNLQGHHANTELDLIVPAEIAGQWHLELMAIDESGNEAIERVVTLSVNNDELPVIQVTSSPSVSANAMIELTASNPVLSLDATVVDGSGIDSVYVSVATEEGEDVFSQSWDAANVLEFSTGSLQITFPGLGLYDLEIRALDSNGFENIWIREVQVQ